MDVKSIKEIKKIVSENRYRLGVEREFSFMCHCGNVKTARWIFKHCDIPNVDAFAIAIASGRITLAKWFHSRTSLRFSNRAWSQYIVPQSCSKWVWRNFRNSCKSYLFNRVEEAWRVKRELQLVSFF